MDGNAVVPHPPAPETTPTLARSEWATTKSVAFGMRWIALGAVFLLPACHGLPQDPEDTLENVRTARQFRVGLVAGTPDTLELRRLLGEIERQTGARPRVAGGGSEALLTDLSEGKTDLVLGAFAKDSPWKTKVAFTPPLRSTGSGKHAIEVKAAMQNGENSWIMLVERASRKVSQSARER